MRRGLFALSLAGATILAAGVPAQTILAPGDAAAGRRLAAERNCTTCHDPTGIADHSAAPYILGQKREYLVRQMIEFRERRAKTPGPYKTAERTHPIMDPKTTPLTDFEIVDLAEYYAGLPCVPHRTFAEADLPWPPLLHRCRFCHGDRGATPYPGYPNIGGQKRDYLVRQLREFRESANHGTIAMSKQKDERFHRTMAPSVYQIGDDEIAALADYYSKQSCQ